MKNERIVSKTIDVSKPLSEKQLQELEKLNQSPINLTDEENPEITDEELERFKLVSEERRKARCKPSVTIRVNPNTLEKGKKIGKGYTSIMARIIDSVFADDNQLEKYL